jgi:hypothetical protein
MNEVEGLMSALERSSEPAFDFNDYAGEARTSLYGQVVRIIGGCAADKLIENFGGRRLYIPLKPAPRDQIPRSIGMRAALAMAREFGSERILVPATPDQARRRSRILKMRANQISISHIARELRCTERYVYKVLATCRDSGLSAVQAPQTTAMIAERLKRGRINPGS